MGGAKTATCRTPRHFADNIQFETIPLDGRIALCVASEKTK
jgi:hypothetical protein